MQADKATACIHGHGQYPTGMILCPKCRNKGLTLSISLLQYKPLLPCEVHPMHMPLATTFIPPTSNEVAVLIPNGSNGLSSIPWAVSQV